jgi:hypothetical protein
MPGAVVTQGAVYLCAHGFPFTLGANPTAPNVKAASSFTVVSKNAVPLMFTSTCTATPPTMGTPPCLVCQALMSSLAVKIGATGDFIIRATDMILATPSGLPVPPPTGDVGNIGFWNDLNPM